MCAEVEHPLGLGALESFCCRVNRTDTITPIMTIQTGADAMWMAKQENHNDIVRLLEQVVGEYDGVTEEEKVIAAERTGAGGATRSMARGKRKRTEHKCAQDGNINTRPRRTCARYSSRSTRPRRTCADYSTRR